MYHVYHRATGLFTGHAVNTDNTAIDIQHLVQENHGSDFAGMADVADPLSQRVDVKTRKLVDYQPPAPSNDHEWDGATRRWHLSMAAQQRQVVAAKIKALEDEQHRPLRELTLDPTNAAARQRLESIEASIEILRASIQSSI